MSKRHKGTEASKGRAMKEKVSVASSSPQAVTRDSTKKDRSHAAGVQGGEGDAHEGGDDEKKEKKALKEKKAAKKVRLGAFSDGG